MLYNAGRHSCNGKLQNVTGLRWRPRQRMACLMREPSPRGDPDPVARDAPGEPAARDDGGDPAAVDH